MYFQDEQVSFLNSFPTFNYRIQGTVYSPARSSSRVTGRWYGVQENLVQ